MSGNSTDQNATFRREALSVLSQSEAAVIQAIRVGGPLSRTDLARQTGFSRAKVTSVVGGLVGRRILKETEEGESMGGRRPRMLNFNADLAYVAGVDIGVTSLDLTLADLQGEMLERHSESADVNSGPEQVLSRVMALLAEMMERRDIPPARLFAVGVGVPAPVEFATGMISAPPMPDWEAYPIRDFVREAFPAAEVVVDNDANVMAFGELCAGRGKVDNLIVVKVGTGIGAGIVCDGQVYRGSTGCAGEIGHVCVDPDGPVCPRCGNIGCLEAMAAGQPIAQRAMEAVQTGRSMILAGLMEGNRHSLTAVDVGVAAATGDRTSIEIIRDSGRMIGEVLAGMVNFYNPKLILINGGVSNIGPQLLSSIRQAMLRRSHPRSTEALRIEYSSLGPDAGIVGAMFLALEHVFVVDGPRPTGQSVSA